MTYFYFVFSFIAPFFTKAHFNCARGPIDLEHSLELFAFDNASIKVPRHVSAVLDNRCSWQNDMLIVEKLYMNEY